MMGMRYDLKCMVEQLVRVYSRMFALKRVVKVENNDFSLSRQVLASALPRYNNKDADLLVDFNTIYECYKLSPKLTLRFLRHAVGHELAHMRLYDLSGGSNYTHLHKFAFNAIEHEASSLGYWASGISTKEFNSIADKLNSLAKSKLGKKLLNVEAL
jgi:hypothetical protein